MSRHHLHRTLVLGGLILALSTPTAQADVFAKKAPVNTAYDWTGFYIGGNAGYGWGRPGTTLEGFPASTWAIFGAAPGVPASYDRNLNGFIGGGQLGYNQQIGKVVLGLETDFSLADIRGAVARSGLDLTLNPYIDDENQRLQWLATVRGRLGFALVDRLMVYATGGLALGKIDATSAFNYHGLVYSGSASETKTGWAAGAGAEYALAKNWSLKFEYLYFDIGTISVIDNTSPPNGNVYTQATVETKNHIARLGLNYRFGGR